MTAPSAPGHLELFERACALTSQMLEAAQAADWARLECLEDQCRVLIDGARRDGACRPEVCRTRAMPRALPQAERARKLVLIRHLLANDAQLRRYAEARRGTAGRYCATGGFSSPA